MLKTVSNAVCAGIMITIGGSVFLSCTNNYIGAFLFSVALLCICYLNYYLFTGKIGYLANDFSKNNIVSLFLGLIINLATTFLIGILLRFCIPSLGQKAFELCHLKLQQTFLITFIRAIFCGILMFTAVEIFREKKSTLGIIFCIPVFILCGFEHSVADMFYFGTSGIFNFKIISFEIAAVLGNTVGSLILPLLTKIANKKLQ